MSTPDYQMPLRIIFDEELSIHPDNLFEMLRSLVTFWNCELTRWPLPHHKYQYPNLFSVQSTPDNDYLGMIVASPTVGDKCRVKVVMEDWENNAESYWHVWALGRTRHPERETLFRDIAYKIIETTKGVAAAQEWFLHSLQDTTISNPSSDTTISESKSVTIRIHPDKKVRDDKIRELHAAGLTQEEIADKVGVHVKTVYRLGKNMGLVWRQKMS